MNDGPARTTEIACRQVLGEDCSVYSSQSLTIPLHHAGAITAEYLLERYLAHVGRFTLSLVRPVRSTEGIDFLLLATRASLLSFSTPFSAESGTTSTVTLRISGGCLVLPGEHRRGGLSFITERSGDWVRAEVRLAGYRPLLLGSGRPPRWRKLVYRLTQALLHKIVTVRFLVHLCHELAGGGTRLRVVKGEGVAGEDI